MYTYQLSPLLDEGKMLDFLNRVESTGWEPVNAYSEKPNQWRVLTRENVVDVPKTYRLMPDAEEKLLSQALRQMQEAGWDLFTLTPAPGNPGYWRILARRSGPGPISGMSGKM